MGRAGRERTLPRYRVERLVDDVDALYRELLAAAGFRSRAPDALGFDAACRFASARSYV